jgi:Mg/Co/Ni transporter MgtE
MEVLLQYLDDLDDVVGMFALAAERLRRAARIALLAGIVLAIVLSVAMLALAQPPLALAAVSLLSVTMLYRAAVNHTTRPITPAEAT